MAVVFGLFSSGGDIVNTKYLCQSWQALLQQVVYLCGRGYHYYHITYLPSHKEEKFTTIDEKLIEKYKTDTKPYTRSRLKAKGVCNYFYIRFSNIAIILKTEGSVREEINEDDKFSDVRRSPMLLSVSDKVCLSVHYFEQKRLTVKLEKECYQTIKASLLAVANTKNKYKMIKTFNNLNGLPSWAGIIAQKRKLAQFLCAKAKKNNVLLEQKELRIIDKRTPVKVWVE